MTDWTPLAPGSSEDPAERAARENQHQVLIDLLGAYADGELPPETTSQIDAHLVGCVRCRRELAVHRAMRRRLGFEPRYRHELPATGTPLLAFAQNTAQNAVEPSADLGRVAKLVQAQPRAATRLLDRVLGVGAHVGAPSRESEQAVEVREHQRVEARVPIGNRG